jgi:hypothetical protein
MHLLPFPSTTTGSRGERLGQQLGPGRGQGQVRQERRGGEARLAATIVVPIATIIARAIPLTSLVPSSVSPSTWAWTGTGCVWPVDGQKTHDVVMCVAGGTIGLWSVEVLFDDQGQMFLYNS